MRANPLPSVDVIRQCLEYDPETGIATWKLRYDRWGRPNKQFAGKPAGYVNGNGYMMVEIVKKKYRLHRVVWKLVHGDDPLHDIDHINHVRTDNRLVNLRAVTRQQNRQNASLMKRSTSGVCGVSWHAQYEHWEVHITVDRKMIRLGYYLDFDQAVAAREAANILYGFHPNHGKPREPA